MSTGQGAGQDPGQDLGQDLGQALAGKVALVTGASSGIGAAVAAMLAQQGAAVVVNARASVEAGAALAERLPRAIFLRADVADPDQAAALVEATVARLGRLDILVNNAGATKLIPHHDLQAASLEVWHQIFDVNVFGTWQLSVAAVPHLRSSGNGVIVNMSSIAGHRPTGSSIPYAVSKAALSHMTLLLANVLGPSVRVNAVAPGLVETPWTQGWDESKQAWERRSPLQRVGTPEEVAQVVLALVQAGGVTGEVVLVDQGMHLR